MNGEKMFDEAIVMARKSVRREKSAFRIAVTGQRDGGMFGER